MKVAIVAGPFIPIPPAKYGGTERVIAFLIKGLKEAGHEPILLGPGDSKPGCELIPTVDKHIFFPRTTAGVEAFNKKLRKIEDYTTIKLREILPDIDIIHSHYHMFSMDEFAETPHLITAHGPITLEEIAYYDNARAKGLFFASISKNQQEAYPDLQWVGAVYNGENPREFPIVKKPDDFVCFAGRFDREKMPHLAIELAISYGIKIKLAGKIDFLGDEYFKTEIKKFIRHPLVEYLGELDRRQLIKLVGRAKLNLHPTMGFREPFGLTVLEAAYCGTPTLAIERGSMPELIEEGKTGFLVEDFVEGLHQIEECFAMDREYIANRARKLFNYEVMTKQYLRAYKKVRRIYKIRQREEQKIQKLRSRSKKELEEIWERDTQGRVLPAAKKLQDKTGLTKVRKSGIINR